MNAANKLSIKQGSSVSPFSMLIRRLTTFRRNLMRCYDIFFDYFMKFLYYGGLHASIAYGLYTKPPLLMSFWYQITGNEIELQKMQAAMYGAGGPPM